MQESSKPIVLVPDGGVALPHVGVVKVAGSDSNSAFEVIEYQGPAAPPPHIHRLHEEVFYILEGRFSFVLGQDSVEADEGTTVYVPRGTRHGFSMSPGSRALLVVSPAGLQ